MIYYTEQVYFYSEFVCMCVILLTLKFWFQVFFKDINYSIKVHPTFNVSPRMTRFLKIFSWLFIQCIHSNPRRKNFNASYDFGIFVQILSVLLYNRDEATLTFLKWNFSIWETLMLMEDSLFISKHGIWYLFPFSPEYETEYEGILVRNTCRRNTEFPQIGIKIVVLNFDNFNFYLL